MYSRFYTTKNVINISQTTIASIISIIIHTQIQKTFNWLRNIRKSHHILTYTHVTRNLIFSMIKLLPRTENVCMEVAMCTND